jgi:hypothetical protein
MSTELDRITELAKEDAKRQFYSIAHMITFGALYAAFRGLRKKASAGVDGVTYEEYERDVAGNIRALHERLKNGKYQAQPLRRVYIPKENGKQRPISIPALEDKIVQKAMVEILNAIYEQDFLDCSYGFRPGRGQHQASGFETFLVHFATVAVVSPKVLTNSLSCFQTEPKRKSRFFQRIRRGRLLPWSFLGPVKNDR